jgi:hypothetical protein
LVGNLILGALLVGAIVAVGIGVTIYQRLNSAPGVLGPTASSTTWSGTYDCAAGPMGLRLELDVEPDHSGERRASSFVTYLSADGSPLGNAVALGVLDDGELSLLVETAPVAGYETSGLRATFSDEATVMTGEVAAAECSTFRLELQD